MLDAHTDGTRGEPEDTGGAGVGIITESHPGSRRDGGGELPSPQLVNRFSRFVPMTKRALLFAIPLAAGIATPASSQGLLAALFGFDAAPPPPRYYDHRVLPTVPPSVLPLPRATRRASRPKTETAAAKRPVIKVEAPPKPITPKPMGEVEN